MLLHARVLLVANTSAYNVACNKPVHKTDVESHLLMPENDDHLV